MIEQIDKNIFLFLNGLHNPFFDVLFNIVSGRLIWLPLYLLILYLIIRNFKKESVIIIFFALLLIILTDQLSVHLFKNVFHRLRPCHDPALVGMVHVVNNNCGGLYGFISSHAANTFALATFISIIFKNKYRFLPVFLLAWATLVSYSRIYLGSHFPGDVLAGIVFGVLMAIVSYFLYKLTVKLLMKFIRHN